MKPFTCFCSFMLLYATACFAAGAQSEKEIVLGADRTEAILRNIQGKRVALIVNQTSILETNQKHILDVLVENGADIKKIFAPEHGFRGTADAGAIIKDSKDQKTGLPIFSLHGKNKKPTEQQLADIDVVIFDIQDIGARFYTYISTMHYAMEACAEYDKEFIVLDRPNPNDFIDGPVLKPGFESFVGMHPIPVLHGLTVGELAWMINGEGWLKSGPNTCKLTVIIMKNWQHGAPYWLPVKPSPNLPNDQSVRLYPSLCFFEATNISVGRGTYSPFQIIGAPDPKYGDYTFTPVSLEGFDTNPLHKDKKCFGEDLRELPFEGGLTLRFFFDFYNKSGNEKARFFSRPEWFDLLAGSKELRTQLIKGLSEEEIKASWQDDLEAYKLIRAKYLLYDNYHQ